MSKLLGTAKFAGEPSQAELESHAELGRFFSIDDADRDLIVRRRGPHSQLGFAVQPGTVGRLAREVSDLPARQLDRRGACAGSTVQVDLDAGELHRPQHGARLDGPNGSARNAATRAAAGTQAWLTGSVGTGRVGSDRSGRSASGSAEQQPAEPPDGDCGEVGDVAD